MIEQMNLKESYNKLSAHQIFKELDINNHGKIKIETFIDYLEKSKEELTPYSDFYSNIYDELTTKSEKIINKLKSIKDVLKSINNKKALDDIDWILANITDYEELNEPDYEKMIKKSVDKEPGSNKAIEYLSNYSQYWEKHRKMNDLVKVQQNYKESRRSFKRAYTSCGYSNN